MYSGISQRFVIISYQPNWTAAAKGLSSVLASKASGCHLETQTLNNYPSGHPNISLSIFLKCRFRFRFSKIVVPCALEESSHSIGRVNPLMLKRSSKNCRLDL